MHEIQIRQEFQASREVVFAAITDHAGMSNWFPGATVIVETPGVPAPNGLGAIRKLSAGGLNIREKVVGWKEPSEMDYELISGAPLYDHLGEMRLESQGAEKTLLDYRIRFRLPWYLGGSLLGSLLAKKTKGDLERGIATLAKQVESNAG